VPRRTRTSGSAASKEIGNMRTALWCLDAERLPIPNRFSQALPPRPPFDLGCRGERYSPGFTFLSCHCSP